MAQEAAFEKAKPAELKKMLRSDRSLHFCRYLLTLPGSEVTEHGKTWWRLEFSGSILTLLAEAFPALSKGRIESALDWMRVNQLRRSQNLGAGVFRHSVAMEPDAAPQQQAQDKPAAQKKVLPAAQPTQPVPVTTDKPNEALAFFSDLGDAAVRAAQKISDLRQQVAQRDAEIAGLREENERLSTELKVFRERPLQVPGLMSSLAQLQQALDN